jgi:hypothetical protein
MDFIPENWPETMEGKNQIKIAALPKMNMLM